MERTFEVVVTSTDNHTWQGVLRGGGEDFHFQSEVQLLLEMAHRVHTEGCLRAAWKAAEECP